MTSKTRRLATYYEYDSDKYISAIKNNENVTVESLTYLSGNNEAKKISAVTDSYTFKFNDISMVIDTKNKDLNKEYKMNVKGDRYAYEYPYFVLVKDKDNAGCVKILLNIDMFSKVVKSKTGDAYTPVKTYNSVDSFVKDVKELESEAKDYLWWETNDDVNKLVLSEIRKHRYNSTMWTQVAGNVNVGFENHLIDNDKGYLNFYGEVYMKDSTTGGKVDIPHFAATLSALLHNTAEISEFAASFIGGGGSEEQVDDLAGWAGDLQSLIYDLQKDPTIKNRYDNGQNYAVVTKLIASDGTQFDHNDMLADVDAVNINAHIDYNGGILSDNLKGYYKNTYQGTRVSSRYASFIQNQFGTTNKETIRTYIGQYLYNDSTSYLLDGYIGSTKTITDAEKRALRDGFLNYIYNINSGK